MNGVFSRLGDRFEVIPDFVLGHRRKIWLAFFLLILAAVPGVGKFEMDLSNESYFSESDPVRQAYDSFRRQFGGDDSLYLVYRARDGDVFSHQSLTAVRDLQEELLNYRLKLQPEERSPLDHMVDITSIINVSYLEPSDSALISRHFVGKDIPTDKQALMELRTTALNHPDYPRTYVAENGEFAALLIRTDFLTGQAATESGFDKVDMDIGSFDMSAVVEADSEMPMNSPPPDEYIGFYHALEAVMSKPEYAGALEYFPIGSAAFNTHIFEELMPQINFWIMFSLVLILAILWFLFRSFSAMVWPMLIIILSSVMTTAMLGYAGIKMDMMFQIVLLLVMAIGVADCIHILSGYLMFRKQGEDHRQALRLTYRKAGLGVTLTSITTALGMLALLSVPLIPSQNFGMAAATGVMFAFLFSLLMLPLMLNLWGPVKKQQIDAGEHHLIQRMLRRIEHWSHVRPSINITLFSLLTLVLIYGALQLKVDTNFVEIFVEGNPIRVAQETTDREMGGSQSMEIMIESDREEAILQPAVLNRIESLQLWLEKDLGHVVTKTQSLVNIVKASNRSLNGGLEEYYAIPQEQQVLRQTLFMFDNANPRDRAMLVSDDYRKTHVTVVFKNLGTRDYMQLLDQINARTTEIFKPLQADDNSLSITPTGSLTIMVRLLDQVSWSQMKGFGVALLSISVILFFAFRSVRVGLIALYPNLLPIVTVFGIMGYADIRLDTDTLLVAPLLIGIVVDDTIHFLTHYRALMEEKADMNRAIVGSFREVGQAISFTSIILIGAFACFTFLDHTGLKNFGVLASIAMFTALAGDLLLLPALLKATRTFADKKVTQQEAAAVAG